MNYKKDEDFFKDRLLDSYGISIAESHGIITGWLSTAGNNNNIDYSKIISFISGEVESKNIQPDFLSFLEEIIQNTNKQLTKFDENYDLILSPSNDYLEKLQSLSDWCNGFITGLQYATSSRKSKLSMTPIAAEAIENIKTTRNIEIILPEESEMETAHKDFEELKEFIKVASESIFLELNKPS